MTHVPVGSRQGDWGVHSLGTSWKLGEVEYGEGITEDFQKKVIFKGTPDP